MSRQALRCEGAPRDLGLDQGRALAGRIRSRVRHEIGSRVDRWLRPRGTEPLTRRVERDIGRFFPHMAERMAGLARGAGVTRTDLAALLARELTASPAAGLIVVAPERGGGIPRIARRVAQADSFLRSSTPGGDYRSLDLACPWLVPALGGVNEHGLAVAAAVAPATPEALMGCAAPATLLVQDCLQRFDAVEKAVEWCVARPAGGRVSLALADAGGDVAVVHRIGGESRLERSDAGVIVASQRPREREQIEKLCAEQTELTAAALIDVLGAEAGSGQSVMLLEPTAHRLSLAPRAAQAAMPGTQGAPPGVHGAPAGEPVWHGVAPPPVEGPQQA